LTNSQSPAMMSYQPYASQDYTTTAAPQYQYESAPAPVRSSSTRFGEAGPYDNQQFPQQQQSANNVTINSGNDVQYAQQSSTSSSIAAQMQRAPSFAPSPSANQTSFAPQFSAQSDDMTACRVSPARVQTDTVREPTPAPIVRQEVERAPTPEGDIVERTVYKREPQEIIEKVIQQPRKPAPRTVVKVVQEPRPAPITRTKCVLVEPRNRGTVPSTTTTTNTNATVTSGNLGGIQQQQQQPQFATQATGLQQIYQ